MSVKSVMKRAICVLCLALVAGMLFALPAYAQKADSDYKYTVRVFPGNIGNCSSGDWLEKSDITAGSNESFSLSSDGMSLSYAGGTISVPADSKYYIKGVRESGQDSGLMANKITEDMDFVVDYGVKGEMVSYTISFIEYGTGNAVATDQGATSVTYHGKQGDKPVVSYEYVPGYRPRYLNITGTLGPEGTNNWTLEYIPLTTEEIVETTTGGGGGTTGGAAAGGAAAGGAAAGGEAASGPAAGTAGGTTTPPATEEIVDVDNPLASGSDKTDTKLNTTDSGDAAIPVAPIVGGVAGLVVVAGVIAAIASRKKKQQN